MEANKNKEQNYRAYSSNSTISSLQHKRQPLMTREQHPAHNYINDYQIRDVPSLDF